MLDQQQLKKQLWYTGQSLLDNRIVGQYFESRLLTREALLSGHLIVSEYVQFEEGETVQYDEPYYVGELPPDIANRPHTVSIEDSFICELKDLQLIGPTALTVTPNGEFVAENALGYRKRVEMGAARCLAAGILPVRKATTDSYRFAVSLVGPWCRNYYHWLIDYLTRLRYLKQYSNSYDETPTLILPNDPPEWMLDGVRLAGFGDWDWIRWNNRRATVDRLLVPSLPRNSTVDHGYTVYGTTPSALRWLRETFLANLPPEAKIDGPQRIYVSRESATERHIRNREMLLEVLDSYGFSVISPENYSLPQQVSLFSQAETVLGATGAGLVNTIFADELQLIVLYGSDTHPAYYALGQCLGFDVGVLQCEPAGEDLIVDPEALTTLFDKMGIEKTECHLRDTTGSTDSHE